MNAYEIAVIIIAVLIRPVPFWLAWKEWRKRPHKT
uniref:Uncharacterized protein n=1 Tax=Candidatus Kentrum sp. FM TaxID=2126340 RepID=A0A450VSH3_9GAMM|nr:MAG: hypothetical protein BECKFM1743C_GA0114222_100155 [Candidatus Kentron sp. FM]VFJ47624.1 MAG: hypothetical protein BECKFM1743A_GA0114220_1004915 [Candidatus Kentron sp. FM]VFK07727.1 MAG: hypothetical protein BECKFM1743B_GA0114221_1004915 [Candidatus Kentron sp. FM]